MSELSSKVSSFEQAQNNTASHIDQRLDDMEKTIDRRISDLEDNQHSLQLDVDALEAQYDQTKSICHHLEKTVENLEHKLDDMDNQNRRNNLIFWGIPKVFGETKDHCEKRVREIIRRDMKMSENIVIDSVQRIGSAVLVRLQSFGQRMEILRHGRELKQINSPVSVREDLTETTRRKRKGLTPLMNQLRDDGMWAQLKKDRLVTDDGEYTFDLRQQQIQKTETRRGALGPRGNRKFLNRSQHNDGRPNRDISTNDFRGLNTSSRPFRRSPRGQVGGYGADIREETGAEMIPSRGFGRGRGSPSARVGTPPGHASANTNRGASTRSSLGESSKGRETTRMDYNAAGPDCEHDCMVDDRPAHLPDDKTQYPRGRSDASRPTGHLHNDEH